MDISTRYTQTSHKLKRKKREKRKKTIFFLLTSRIIWSATKCENKSTSKASHQFCSRLLIGSFLRLMTAVHVFWRSQGNIDWWISGNLARASETLQRRIWISVDIMTWRQWLRVLQRKARGERLCSLASWVSNHKMVSMAEIMDKVRVCSRADHEYFTLFHRWWSTL